MTTYSSEKLIKRLTKFAIDCQKLTLKLPKNHHNIIYSKQLIRSSSSPAANYIEAIEAASGKDFIHRLKICKKEINESVYWLEMINQTNIIQEITAEENGKLMGEGVELVKIFASSVITTERNQKLKMKK